MNFTSQICTTKEQSERLLALGLNKETADMGWVKLLNGDGYVIAIAEDYSFIDIPAWSFHRLIEMMPSNIIENERRYNFSLDHGCSLYEYDKINKFGDYEYDCIGTSKTTSNLYDDLINQIEWLIKRNYFNKEYLN